jgi:hypothetical protein
MFYKALTPLNNASQRLLTFSLGRTKSLHFRRGSDLKARLLQRSVATSNLEILKVSYEETEKVLGKAMRED